MGHVAVAKVVLARKLTALAEVVATRWGLSSISTGGANCESIVMEGGADWWERKRAVRARIEEMAAVPTVCDLRRGYAICRRSGLQWMAASLVKEEDVSEGIG